MRPITVTFITDVLPDDRFTAGQVLRKIISHLGGDRVDVFWINQSLLPAPSPDDPLYRLKREYRFQLSPRLGSLLDRVVAALGRTSKLSLLLQSTLMMYHCGRIAWSVARSRRGSKDDFVWLVLQGEKLLLVYWLLALFEPRRIVLQQWDPLSWWMLNRNHHPKVVKLMQGVLRRLQERVWLNVVPSPQWEAELSAAGLRAVRVDNFFSAAELQLPRAVIRLCSPEKLNVVFTGQLYANSELKRCLEVLVASAAELQLSVVLHYFGASPCPRRGRVEVVPHGYLSCPDLIAAIGKWDLALLPYPSEARFAETARLSFASKSRVYVAAGLPILAYAPEDSSIHQFFSQHYPDYYMNCAPRPDIVDFVRACKHASPAQVRARRDFARRLVAEWFSAEAEMDRLTHLLEVGRDHHGNPA